MNPEINETGKIPSVMQIEKNISDLVLNRINDFQKNGTLHLPADYSAANALKFAWLVLVDTKDKEKKPVLQTCSKESICNALLRMVVQGLNPMKHQCSFVSFGTSLTLMREYQGSVAMAKRTGLKRIAAQVVYEGDKFIYEIDPATGTRRIVKHEQVIENIDFNKIKGAYAITISEDGETDVVVMNYLQIKKSWAMGAMKGTGDVHKDFPDEMCKKTVISRACKPFINQSDDAYLFGDSEEVEIENSDEGQVIQKEILSIVTPPSTESVIIIEKKENEAKENEAKEKKYKSLVGIGDSHFKVKNFEIAFKFYKQANDLMPEDSYIIEKLNEIAAMPKKQISKEKKDNNINFETQGW